MKTTEIRFGNLIHNPRNGECEPVSLKTVVEMVGDEKTNELEEMRRQPIPLTEEWLEKFGLKSINLGECQTDLENKVGKWTGDKLFSYVVATYFDEYSTACYITRKIEFVHQLQNMYFAHVQSELIYKT